MEHVLHPQPGYPFSLRISIEYALTDSGLRVRTTARNLGTDPIVFVMSAKDSGAAERARSKVQLLNGHSDVRESVEEVMQTIENDGLLAKDDMSSARFPRAN